MLEDEIISVVAGIAAMEVEDEKKVLLLVAAINNDVPSNGTIWTEQIEAQFGLGSEVFEETQV